MAWKFEEPIWKHKSIKQPTSKIKVEQNDLLQYIYEYDKEQCESVRRASDILWKLKPELLSRKINITLTAKPEGTKKKGTKIRKCSGTLNESYQRMVESINSKSMAKQSKET